MTLSSKITACTLAVNLISFALLSSVYHWPVHHETVVVRQLQPVREYSDDHQTFMVWTSEMVRHQKIDKKRIPEAIQMVQK